MSELITACRDGDIEKVKQLLDNNANVNESDVCFVFFLFFSQYFNVFLVLYGIIDEYSL